MPGDLATEGARAITAMVFTHASRFISVSTPEWLYVQSVSFNLYLLHVYCCCVQRHRELFDTHH